MATNTWVYTVTTTEDMGVGNTTDVKSGQRPFVVLRNASNFFSGIANGSRFGTVDVQLNGGASVAASGTITMAAASGTVGAVINGVTITVTWATSDTASSTALAAAINASGNALVQGIVTAKAVAGVTTITAVTKGLVGNSVLLTATGTNVTASGSGRLAGGVATTANAFTN